MYIFYALQFLPNWKLNRRLIKTKLTQYHSRIVPRSSQRYRCWLHPPHLCWRLRIVCKPGRRKIPHPFANMQGRTAANLWQWMLGKICTHPPPTPLFKPICICVVINILASMVFAGCFVVWWQQVLVPLPHPDHPPFVAVLERSKWFLKNEISFYECFLLALWFIDSTEWMCVERLAGWGRVGECF